MTRSRPAEPRALTTSAAKHEWIAPLAPRMEPGVQPAGLANPPAAVTTKPSVSAPSRASTTRAARPAVTGEPPDQPARTTTSRLAEESSSVIAARQAFRDGDPARCLRLLETARAEFPDGSLAQEREALTIQALARSGQRDLAAQRAVRFLREHPESPHAADFRQIAR